MVHRDKVPNSVRQVPSEDPGRGAIALAEGVVVAREVRAAQVRVSVAGRQRMAQADRAMARAITSRLVKDAIAGDRSEVVRLSAGTGMASAGRNRIR